MLIPLDSDSLHLFGSLREKKNSQNVWQSCIRQPCLWTRNFTFVSFCLYSRLVWAFRKVVGFAFGHPFFVCVCTDLCSPRLLCSVWAFSFFVFTSMKCVFLTWLTTPVKQIKHPFSKDTFHKVPQMCALTGFDCKFCVSFISMCRHSLLSYSN